MWNEINKFIDRLHQSNVDFIELTPQEVEKHKQEWFEEFVPIDKRDKALDCYCFDKDGYCGYLWHAFSYEILVCLIGDEAKVKFNNLDKGEAVLLMNIDDMAYRIKDTSELKAEDFDILYDAILTDHDFNWTYVKTHEEVCGPYFYSV